MSSFVDRRLKQVTKPAVELALYRAFLTVFLEKMDQIDDSSGVMGGLYSQIFERYGASSKWRRPISYRIC